MPVTFSLLRLATMPSSTDRGRTDETIKQSNEAAVAACDAMDKKARQSRVPPSLPSPMGGREGGSGVRRRAVLPHSCPIYRISIVIIRSALPMSPFVRSSGVKATEKEIGATWSDAKRPSVRPSSYPLLFALSLPHRDVTDTRRLSVLHSRLLSSGVWIHPIRPTDPHHQLRRAARRCFGGGRAWEGD